jgi:hypothetical protein
MSGKALLNNFNRKSDASTKSKTHPALNPETDRSASIDHIKSQNETSSRGHSQEEALRNYRSFQRTTRWDRFLRSSFFRKAVKKSDGNSASESHLAINAIDDRVSTTFVIHPESKFKRYWDLLEDFVIILQFFVIPVLLGFTEFREGLPIFQGITTGIFLFSMYISFRTGIIRNFVLLMDPDLIVDSYLKSWSFPFDIITTFPYVYVIDAVSPASSNELLNHGLRFICVLNALRILKLANSKDVWWYSWFLNKLRMKTKINAASVGIAKVFNLFLNL